MWVRFTTDMRQETLLRGLVDCCVALGWVPWVVVFDNMKTVTSGRDAANQPIWTAPLLHLAQEFGFHPEACAPRAANQKGAVESLVKFVKGNFLAGRDFADDVDLAQQQDDWLIQVNQRPSRATDHAPQALLPEEAQHGGALPTTAANYGFHRPGHVSREALVAIDGNQYSVPIAHVGSPVTVRLYPTQVAIWRDTECLAVHERAPEGAHRRVVIPEHYSPLFGRKPRAQVMLYRQALLDLGEVAVAYVTELSHRQRAHLGPEILGLYALLQQQGAAELISAMALAQEANAFGADYLRALVATPRPLASPPALCIPGAPPQADIDRALALYETYVQGAAAPTLAVPG
jgi:hypothetical protein